MLKASTSIRNSVNAKKLKENDFDEYYKYGSHIPKTITGSKNY